MAGCSANHSGEGDKDAGRSRVIGWVAGGAILFGLAGYLTVAGIGVAGGAAGLLAVAVIAVMALAGAAVGFWVGYAVNWFDRLFAHDPSTVTVSGCVLCAGKNTGFPPFNDGDWTFNLGGPQPPFAVLAPTGLSLSELRNRDAPDNGLAFEVVDPSSGQAALHCEISSKIGDYAAVGGAIGSVAGAVAGAFIGAAICVALGLATFGIGALVCALVVAIAILVGAVAGGFAGDAIGAGIGAIADELSDFDERGEAISRGCLMTLTGRWVTDSNHQWNEVHDIESAQLVECNDCDDATGSASAGLIAAVGIGRHPTGVDP